MATHFLVKMENAAYLSPRYNCEHDCVLPANDSEHGRIVSQRNYSGVSSFIQLWRLAIPLETGVMAALYIELACLIPMTQAVEGLGHPSSNKNKCHSKDTNKPLYLCETFNDLF